MRDFAKAKPRFFGKLERLVRLRRAAEEDTGGKGAGGFLTIQRDLALRLSGAGDLRDTLEIILNGILRATGMDSGGIYLVDRERGDLEIAYHKGFSDAFVQEISHYDADSSNAELVNAGEPVYIEYERLDVPKSEAERAEGIRTIAIVPIWSQGKVIGCVNIASHVQEEIPQGSRHLIEALAGQVGEAVARSRLEARVRESEERYRVLHDYAGYAVFAFDRDLRLTDVNRWVCEILGYGENELLGRNVIELGVVHPDESEIVASNIQRLFSAKSAARETVRFITKDGRTVIADSVSVPLLDEEGEVFSIVNIAQDITDRKETEEALYLEREQLLSIFDGINEAIYVSDPETYEVLYANQHLKDAFGKELLGGVCYREFQGLDEPCAFCTNDIILADQGEPYSWEYYNPVLDRHFTITDRIIKWPDGRDVRFELAVDITEQKRAEEEIRKNEAKYRGLIEGLRGALYRMSLPDGAYEYFSPDVEDVFGYTSEEFIANPMLVRQVIHPDFTLYFREKWADLLEGKVPPTYEYKIIDPRGEERWIYQSNRGVFDDEGKIIALEGLCTDISERKRTEDELQKYRGHLEELVEERTARLEEVNAELEAFTYSVSHDLRAPLRAMQGFSRALQEDYAEVLDEKGRDYAERIISAARRMDSLISDLLEYSHITRSEMKLEAVSLGEVVKDALQQLEAGIREKGATVTVEGPLPGVEAHYATLLQVVANLISNAITFTAPGVKPEVRIGGEERDGWVRLCVADNGIGIAPEYRDRIFRIFERLHGMETYPGTGIGLAVVSKGMKRMGGRVGMESVEGKGSEFWIELPKGEKEA
ncbi:MAG: PAS domain S-box protein [Actinobacteria bacterium]|jgi:PAS domain S-box-containing protein|nr:MAG: PAS domain S-box protein [Actinomycetota bacterium]